LFIVRRPVALRAELFEFDDHGCWVARQPSTTQHREQMILDPDRPIFTGCCRTTLPANPPHVWEEDALSGSFHRRSLHCLSAGEAADGYRGCGKGCNRDSPERGHNFSCSAHPTGAFHRESEVGFVWVTAAGINGVAGKSERALRWDVGLGSRPAQRNSADPGN
jgi:hypothetical protein